MKTFQTSTWQQKIVVAIVAMLIGAAAIEMVAGAMEFPDAGTMAIRERFLAMESERALEIRTLQQEQLRIATTPLANGN
jgi:hypothetical protein